MENIPSFIITIDTEGDNLWSKPPNISTRNAEYLFRFQELCEKYGYKPTYFTNYEMAKSTCFQELGNDVIKRKTGEIGMHLHAWNMPPFHYQLTDNDYLYQPYLIEYPQDIIKEKVKIMTEVLEDIFQIKMMSHRAGRWGLNETYAKILIDNGYLVDTSVTPLYSWKGHMGDPKQNGGTDYRNYPNSPYYIDLNDLSSPGDSSLLEIPMTIEKIRRNGLIRYARKIVRISNTLERIADHYYPKISWLRPNGRNLRDMLSILKNVNMQKRDFVMFMLHSSEFMPGGSPTFRTQQSIEKLYVDMEKLFIAASEYFAGCTATEFRMKIDKTELLSKNEELSTIYEPQQDQQFYPFT